MSSQPPRRSALWKTFDIDGHTWKIFLAPKDHRYLSKNGRGGPYDGRAFFRFHSIFVRNDLPPAEVRETINHEVLHVATGMWPGDVEEAVVQSLSPRQTLILEQLLTGWPDLQ